MHAWAQLTNLGSLIVELSETFRLYQMGRIIIASASPYVEVASGENWRHEFNIYDLIL
jgi:hypothetical protein